MAAGTVVVIALLGLGNPFQWIADRTSGSETTRMQPTHLSGDSWDLSHGEDLRGTLTGLPPLVDGERRILVFGNSQQYSCSLPRGGVPKAGHEAAVASDLVVERLNEWGQGRYAVFNNSAPNQNFAEALWLAVYWFQVAPKPPDVLVIQSSFDTFRKTGIRAGYQTMLDEPAFARTLAAYTGSHPATPWAATFAAARRELDLRRAELAADARWSLEGTLRAGLSAVPLFARREEYRSAMLNDLYYARVMLLRIRPTTRRHIAGAPYAENWAALEELVSLARARGTKVLVYNAPVNPQVSMFFDGEYRDYLSKLRLLATTRCQAFADLSDAVPAEQWGYWIDGPDPIHVDEAGHRTIAARLFDAFAPRLASR